MAIKILLGVVLEDDRQQNRLDAAVLDLLATETALVSLYLVRVAPHATLGAACRDLLELCKQRLGFGEADANPRVELWNINAIADLI